ncbi:glycoside hydrolase family 19 protein [Roseibium alexandrii]
MNLDLGDTRLILAECKRYGCLRNQAAYILATAYWETARTMKPVKEAYWLSEDWRRKNLRYYPWYGRGYVQLTWEANYKKAGNVLGVNFIADPDKLLEPENSARILVQGSMEGWFTGKKIPDYITLKKSDFRNARRVINGMDKASEIAKLARGYDEALKAENYGMTDIVAIPQPKPEAKPEVHKPLAQSKEMIMSVTGIITAITAFLEKIDGSTVALIMGALALGFMANRLYARFKEDR